MKETNTENMTVINLTKETYSQEQLSNVVNALSILSDNGYSVIKKQKGYKNGRY